MRAGQELLRGRDRQQIGSGQRFQRYPQSLLKQDISTMPLSFLGLLKCFIGVVSILLLSGLSRSTAQGQTLLTGGEATFPHPIYASVPSRK